MRCSRSTALAIAALGLLAAILPPATATATYTEFSGTVQTVRGNTVTLPDDGRCDFHRRILWTFPATGDAQGGPFPSTGTAMANWLVSDTDSPVIVVGPPLRRDLHVVARHQSGSNECHTGHGANATSATMKFEGATQGIVRPPNAKPVRIRAVRINHGDHADFFNTRVEIPEMDEVIIDVWGEHERDVEPFQWSFHNTSVKKLTNVRIIPSFLDDDGDPMNDEDQAIDVGDVNNGGRKRGAFENTANAPTNYTVEAFGSPLSSVTLAYLGEDADFPGIVTELPLAAMSRLWGRYIVPGETFTLFAPMIRDPDELIDLYAFVDLSEYLANDVQIVPGAIVGFAAGEAPGLPGVFVSTTPISLDTSDGSLSGTPYDGNGKIAALIDGGVPGEPVPAASPPAVGAIVVLLGLAGACVLLIGRSART